MKFRWVIFAGIVQALTQGSLALAEPSGVAQVEINYLLNYVEISGCEFHRNGSWHDSVKAQQHLRVKYDYLSARHRIATAEDFIRLAATKSSLSGRAYEVRCGDCSTVTTGTWLTDVLARYRIVVARESASPSGQSASDHRSP